MLDCRLILSGRFPELVCKDLFLSLSAPPSPRRKLEVASESDVVGALPRSLCTAAPPSAAVSIRCSFPQRTTILNSYLATQHV